MSSEQFNHQLDYLVVADAGAGSVDPIVWLDICSGGEPLQVDDGQSFRFGQAIVLAFAAAIVGLMLLFA